MGTLALRRKVKPASFLESTYLPPTLLRPKTPVTAGEGDDIRARLRLFKLLLEALDAISEEWDSGVAVETFAMAHSAYVCLRCRGVVFAPDFADWMEGRRLEAFGTDADSDYDMLDDILDLENDGDHDRDEYPEIDWLADIRTIDYSRLEGGAA